MRYQMEKGLRITVAVAFLATAAALSADGQNAAGVAANGADSSRRAALTSPGQASAPALLPGRLIRVIEDPSLGDHWLLCRNVEHPGGPGRLLRVVPAGSETRKFRTDDGLESDPAAIRPVIRAGDRVVVEESSAVAEARLGAVALESARAGSALNVRLEIGGRVVRAVALGTGRAVFQVEIGVRR